MNEAKLDEYLREGQRLFNGEITFDDKTIDDDEVEGYKESKIVPLLHEARDAVLAGKNDWPALVKKGLANNLVQQWGYMAIRHWLDNYPDDAWAALREFWAEGDTPLEKAAERIRAFVDKVPRDTPNWGGEGAARSRLRVASVLLMALPEGYPPFKATEYEKAFRHMEHDPHPSRSDEDKIYDHAIKFLDHLLKRKEALGFERPRDRRDAQSLLWTMDRFLKNGEIVMPPPKDPNSSDPLTDPLDALAEELLLPPKFLREIADLLEDKRQIIFQGPPGTGKTWVARKLAECLAGDKDRVELVQFHPSYAYEDFVQGFRPTLEDGKAGFVLRDGPLLQMADQALFGDPDKMYFLIIDEINRGNLAKVFGELYFLLEYRDEDGEDNEMRLQYSDQEFSLPPNLYIIGTMNTADRSIALVDAALRRRFHFVEFHPDEEPIKDLLERWLRREAEKREWSDTMEWLPGVVERANEKLGDQRRDAAIGPSYFMKGDIPKKLDLVWNHNVIPYVEEQIYDQRGRIKADFALQTLRDEVKRASNARPPEGDGEQGGSGETTAGDEGN